MGCFGNCSLLHVALVPHDDYRRHGVLFLLQYLLPESGDLRERCFIIDGIHQDECVGRINVQSPHGRELIGSGSIQKVERDSPAVNEVILRVHVLHSCLVIAHKLLVEEAIDEASFPHTSGSHHNDAVTVFLH